MSEFLHHTSCPNCGSRDNLGVWDDHAWCFGCGHWEPRGSRSLAEVGRSLLEIKEDKRDGPALPADFSRWIPPEPTKWLMQYHLTKDEIFHNHLGWSPSEQMLIFPFLGGDNELLCWQGRYFPKRSPKVFTMGYPDRHVLLVPSPCVDFLSNVVVVEDAVSAIKVARYADSCPLLGAHLSLHKAVGLSRLYKKLILWLDNDKIKEMMKFKNRYTHLFEDVKIVISDKDPKYYNEEIKEYLNV